MLGIGLRPLLPFALRRIKADLRHKGGINRMRSTMRQFATVASAHKLCLLFKAGLLN
ncbi:hypothetical protein PSAB6_70416 [Paraburkholderia sabiae]|nr:hypothetical protein PSAB6_70416 [Paraburkholderia sabiae]